MSEYIITNNDEGDFYAYYMQRFWRCMSWQNFWHESPLTAQAYAKAHSKDPELTPERFFEEVEHYTILKDGDIGSEYIQALLAMTQDKQSPTPTAPCGNIKPVKEESSAPVPTTAADVAEPFGNIPTTPSFDFSALGDLSGQAEEADQQFDLHYGTAQDEYLISCIYLARVHALTAKAGRYGGGTWTKWYESKGIGAASVHRMLQTGEGFKSSTMEDLKCLPELTRKDLNLIARSGCAEQLTAAAGDSQRVQELLAQIKAKDDAIAAEKERADAAEAQRDAAQADVAGLHEQNSQLKESLDAANTNIRGLTESYNIAKKNELAQCDHLKDLTNQLEGSRQIAEAAKLRADKYKAENEALRVKPIEAVVDEEEVDRRAGEKAYEIAAGMTAEYKAQQEQDARSAYDSILLAGRSFTNTWQIAKPALCKLPPEQREAAANQLIHTLGQIQGEVSQCL